jgi:hypothetical protein
MPIKAMRGLKIRFSQFIGSMFTITVSGRQGDEANVFTEVLQKGGDIFARLIGGQS